MSGRITPPIIVIGDDGPNAFASVEAAEGYMEAIDVEEGVYSAAYDANGCCLAISVESEPSRALFGLIPGTIERIVLAPAERVDCEGELRRVITEHLSRLGSPLPALRVTLSEAVAAFVARCGYTAE